MIPHNLNYTPWCKARIFDFCWHCGVKRQILLVEEWLRSQSDQGGLMMSAESDSVVCFFLLRNDRFFFVCFFCPECSSPVPSLPSDGDWLRAGSVKRTSEQIETVNTRSLHWAAFHYLHHYQKVTFFTAKFLWKKNRSIVNYFSSRTLPNSTQSITLLLSTANQD